MAKLIMLVGVSYSGKSTVAEEYARNENGIIVSSDAIRKELLGSEEDQSNNNKVFEIVHTRIRDGLAANKTVIYDATNLNARRRRNFLSTLPKDCDKMCVMVIANLDTIKQRMATRERVVPWEVIEKQLHQFQTPWYHEGWDAIGIRYNNNHNTHYSIAKDLEEAKAIPQDNPWHTLTIGDHCQMAYDNYVNYVLDNNAMKYSRYVGLAALYHDIGKKYTKVFTNLKGEPSDRAHFYFHQNYGAYLILTADDLDNILDSFYASVLVTYHMEYFTRSPESYQTLLTDLDELGEDLQLIHWCDENAGQNKGV